MGFYSAKCRVCGLEVLNEYADRNGPLSEVTVVNRRGKVVAQGRYDGYGAVGGVEVAFSPSFTSTRDSWFHTECWEWAGKPGFMGPSQSAPNQGFFDSEATKRAWNALVKQRRGGRP